MSSLPVQPTPRRATFVALTPFAPVLCAAVFASVLFAPALAPLLACQTPVPAPAFLSGVVREASGAPLADVDVTLLGESQGTRTDSGGVFTLRDVPAGSHTALFRRIGYQSVEYRWVGQPGRGLQIAIVMTPVPRQLDRVVVEAPGGSRRRGTSSIGGVITDSAGRGVAAADVRLLGSGLSTVSDSAGRFQFQLLAAGPYIVRARQLGSNAVDHVMQIADDDVRDITLKLRRLPKGTSSRDSAAASGFGAADLGFDAFDHRQRVNPASPVLATADLYRANRTPLDLLLQQYRSASSPNRRGASTMNEGAGVGAGGPLDGDCLLIDGRRSVYQPLGTFTSLDVQLVEVFRANAFVDQFVVEQMETLKECRGSMDHHPAYFALWTRSLR